MLPSHSNLTFLFFCSYLNTLYRRGFLLSEPPCIQRQCLSPIVNTVTATRKYGAGSRTHLLINNKTLLKARWSLDDTDDYESVASRRCSHCHAYNVTVLLRICCAAYSQTQHVFHFRWWITRFKIENLVYVFLRNVTSLFCSLYIRISKEVMALVSLFHSALCSE